jgi:hypothetical protein
MYIFLKKKVLLYLGGAFFIESVHFRQNARVGRMRGPRPFAHQAAAKLEHGIAHVLLLVIPQLEHLIRSEIQNLFDENM